MHAQICKLSNELSITLQVIRIATKYTFLIQNLIRIGIKKRKHGSSFISLFL